MVSTGVETKGSAPSDDAATAQLVPAPGSPSTSLQDRVDAVLVHNNDDAVRPAPLRSLMVDLLDASELEAFVRVYDEAKLRGVRPDEDVRAAMEKRHRRRSGGRNSLRVPAHPAGTRALAPARRLHKIVVGPKRGKVLARRSAAATPDKIDRVVEWASDPSRQSKRARELLDRKAWETKKGRKKLAIEMTKAGLRLCHDAALGAITSLKRKRVFR